MNARALFLAFAVSVGGNLLMIAPARAACTIRTTPVSFGSYNVFATTPVDATGQVTFQCVPSPMAVTIWLDQGGAPSFNPRLMRQGSETVNYNLYLDGARTIIWGNGTGGTQVFVQTLPDEGQDFTVPVFGRVPAGQDVSAGIYTNTIIVTIFF